MKRLLLMFLCLILAFAAVGCSHEIPSGQSFVFCAHDAPLSLDPLLASNQSERMGVENLFEALFDLNGDGTVSCASAKGYTWSQDGLQLTVTLRPDLMWSDGLAVTAGDYVFALQRAVTPATGADCAKDLVCLVNAKEILAGKQDSLMLGVQAQGVDTIVFQLTQPDKGLLAALAGVAGIPCRRDFFRACGGRYGMDDESLITNGAFTLSTWSDDPSDSYITIKKHENYWNKANVLPYSVRINFSEKEDCVTQIAGGFADGGVITGGQYNGAVQAGLGTISYYTDGYALLFNTHDTVATGNEHLRRALVGALAAIDVSSHLPEYCVSATSVITPDNHFQGTAYPVEEERAITWGTYGLPQAAEDFNKAKEEIEPEELKKLTLYYAEDAALKPALDSVLQCWQKQFGLYVELLPVTKGERDSYIQNGNFYIALCPMNNSGKDSLGVLTQFTQTGNSVLSGFADKTYEALIKTATQSGEMADQTAAEQHLLQKAVVCPVYYSREYYGHATKVSGLALNEFTGALNFEKASRKD